MNEVWEIDMEDERVNLVKGIIAEKLATADPLCLPLSPSSFYTNLS